MNNKILLYSAAALYSWTNVAAEHTNFVIINLDDVGYGDFSCNGAYGYTTPPILTSWRPMVCASPISWQHNRSVELRVPDC